MLWRLIARLLRRRDTPAAPASATRELTGATLAELAAAELDAGRADDARRIAHEALALNRDCLKAHMVLAHLELRGPAYLDILARVHAHLHPATYIEVGVAEGDSLASVQPGTIAIGVDPQPRITQPLAADVRVFSETSDAFFARRDVRALFGGRPVDLAFIDGMHLFEHALSDFANIERLAHPNTVILIHDGYPLDEQTATRERCTTFWSGDIWRMVIALKRHRSDLEIVTLNAPPTGLCVVRNLDPASTLLRERMDGIVAECMAIEFAEIGNRKAEALNLAQFSDTLFERLFARA